VLSIGKLAAGGRGARYYTRTVARGREDYYAGKGEAPGRWTGSGWGSEESDGEVSEHALRSLLDGLHPRTKDPIRQQQPRATLGFDLTFSAPKSVSIVYGIAEETTTAAVREAHDAAVRDALGYLERCAARTRRGKGGKLIIDAGGFVAAAFRHRTSRAGDPQLHTHVVVANGVRGADGRWSALDARFLYRHHKTAGYLYQAALRRELSERLGVQWTNVVKGGAEIKGIPRSLIHHFSRRRDEIVLHLARRGFRTAAAAEIAALDTRRQKQYDVPVDRLRADWRARAEEQGFGHEALVAVLRRERFEARSLDYARLSDELAGRVTREDAIFDRRTVLQSLAEAHSDGAASANIEALADLWLRRDEVVQLDDEVAVLGEPAFSTRELLQLEAELLAGAEGRADAGVAQGRTEAVDAAVRERPTIAPEQIDLVAALVTSGDGVQVVRSAAGTGKTFALDAAREAWEQSGIQVVGCALSARAAVELRDQAGIPSLTIARLKLDVAQGNGLAPGSVLIVDEAGMVGTRDLAELADHAEISDAKLVLVGDDRQLPEINAGGSFRALADRLGALELREVRRQRHEWDRAALLELRDGDVAEWASAYRANGRLVAGPHADATRDALVDGWWRDLAEQDTGRETVMVALRRRDVADLNDRARDRMRQAGYLGNEELTVGSRLFSPGDQVVIARNDRILEVANGERGRVVSIDPVARSMRIELNEREVELPSRYLDDDTLHHAYAMTAHRLQGATVDRAHVLGSDELYRECGYTAMSRHRDTAHFYVTTSQPQEPLPGMDDYDAMARDVVSPMRRERAKSLAIDRADVSVGSREAPDPDEALRLLESMPANVRALPAAAQRQEHATRELAAARARLLQTEQELSSRRWLLGEKRRELARRAAGHRSAIEYWTEQADLSGAALEEAGADAASWMEQHHDSVAALRPEDALSDLRIETHAVIVRLTHEADRGSPCEPAQPPPLRSPDSGLEL